MNVKSLTLEIAVVLACYLVMTLPVTSATTVNIKLNGQTMNSVEYEPSNIVNLHITYVRDPRDIGWSNVRIAITLNSASLAHTIKRVYLYKCGSLSPVGCMQKTPEVFDTYVDTEIAWDDIGQSTGTSKYPQEGNLLFLVKLENPDGLTSWIGLWNTIRRNSHNEFLFYNYELSDMDVHASSSSLVGPIASYIQNFNVIPFEWLTSAAFDDALSISAIGGDDGELETSPPVLQTVEPATNEITVINKENYFVFPETASGTAFPITLEQNPDFQCGDGQCESGLGESSETCCYDCGCETGYYCDAPQGSPEDGICRDESLIDLTVVGTPTADVSDCTQTFEVGVTAEISNVPASMGEELNAIVTAGGTNYAAQCTKSVQGRYYCTFTMSPTIECGSVDKAITPNELKLTINYNDGPDGVTRDLTESFPTISLNYDCSCTDSGDYCDTGTETCEPEDSITLSITELNSYLSPYSPGDTIDLTAKISNPPTGTVLMSASANFTLTGGDVYPGSPECTGPNDDYEYECSIQFSITGYSKENDYSFYPNFLTFDITYNDGPDAATKILTTGFGPISIPNQDCGNGVCDADETPDTCCQDCGCEQQGYYCDVSKGCSSIEAITLSTTTYPVEFEDCAEAHEVGIQATIKNVPYGVNLDYSSITVNSQPVSWGFDCAPQVGGIYNCDLEIPPIEGCELPFYTVGPNELAFTISFPNGDNQQNTINRELNSSFDSIYITPVPHIDGECEAGLGENGSTACLDCPCDEDPYFASLEGEYYCDASPSNPGGTCLPKNNITLVVESPTSPLTFDSCEKYNKLNVLMHVRNQPSGMDAENVYATIGAEAADYVSCSESRGTYLDSNITFNCTIGIRPIDICTQGQTYNYTNNSISLIISYENGERGAVLQSLSHDLPDFYIHQTYRSLYQITEDLMDQMEAILDNIMQITEDMVDRVHHCIQLQMAVMWLTLASSIALGIYGAREAAEGKRLEGFSEGVRTAGELSGPVSEGIKAYCDMLYKLQEILQKEQEMMIEKAKMGYCLALMQHAMDAGECKGDEEGCFDQIVNCLSYIDDIGDIMGEMTKLAGSIGDDMTKMNDAIIDLGDELGGGTYDGASLYVSLGEGRRGIESGSFICPKTEKEYHGGSYFNLCYPEGSSGGSNYGLVDTVLYVTKAHPSRCDYSFVALFDESKGMMELLQNKPPSSGTERYELNLQIDYPSGKYRLYMFCSDEATVNIRDYDMEEDKIIPPFVFSVAPYDNDIKKCINNGSCFTGLDSGQDDRTTLPTQTSVCGADSNRVIATRDANQRLYKQETALDGTQIYGYNDELSGGRECRLNRNTQLKVTNIQAGCRTRGCPYDEMWEVELISPGDDDHKDNGCNTGVKGWIIAGTVKCDGQCQPNYNIYIV